MIDYLTKRPMLLCGIICGLVAVLGYYLSITLLIFGILSVILIAYLLIKRRNPVLIFVLILIVIMVLNAVFTYSRVDKTLNYTDKTLRLTFVVCDIGHESADYNKAEVEIKNGVDAIKDKRVSVIYYDHMQVGKTYTADIKFREIDDEYKLMNYSNDIFFSGYLSNIKLEDGREDTVLIYTEKLRNYIRKTVFKYLRYDEAATLCALLFGDNSYFTDEFYGNVKAAGVSHVMVVSGMHLAVIVGFFTRHLNRFTFTKYIKAICIVGVVLFLTALCGFTMSMLRAGITYLFIAVSLLADRKNTPANTLGAAFTLILISSPFAIFNVAFQLSMLSTFGILAVAMPITDYLEQNDIIKSGVLKAIVFSAILSLSAFVMTLPVCIYIFGYVSVVGIITNLLISNVVTITICTAIIALILSPFSHFITALVMMPCYGMLKYTNFVINFFGNLPCATVSLPRYSVFFAIFLIILVFWILIACKNRRDVLKLEEVRSKIIKESGKRVKWQ